MIPHCLNNIEAQTLSTTDSLPLCVVIFRYALAALAECLG